MRIEAPAFAVFLLLYALVIAAVIIRHVRGRR